MYIINKTDGSIAATVNDGVVNTTNTDLALIGKNYLGYGEYIAENFVKLLENFAYTQAPTKPLTGQLWYNKNTNQLLVYNGLLFKSINPTANSATAPTNPTQGEFWYDTVNQQLKFYQNSSWTVIAPLNTVGQGKSGLEVSSVTDNTTATRVINTLYHAGTSVAIIAKENFTPLVGIAGFGDIKAGINLKTGFVLNGTATNSLSFNNLSSTAFLRSDINSTTIGSLSVSNNLGLFVGTADDFNIAISLNGVELVSSTAGNDIEIKTTRPNAEQVISTTISADGDVYFSNAATANTFYVNNQAVINSVTIDSGNVFAAGNVSAVDNLYSTNAYITNILQADTVEANQANLAVANINSLQVNTTNTTEAVNIDGNIELSGTNLIRFKSVGSNSAVYGNNGKIGLATQGIARLEINEFGNTTLTGNISAVNASFDRIGTSSIRIQNNAISAPISDLILTSGPTSQVVVDTLYTATTATVVGNILGLSNASISGSLGVGVAGSGTIGEIRATGNIVSHYSDIRLKDNIKNIDNALEKICQINGVTYQNNSTAKQFGFTDDQEQIGVLAQEIEKIIPNAVQLAPFDTIIDDNGNKQSKSGQNYKTVQYEKIIPLLIEAVKELSKKINENKS